MDLRHIRNFSIIAHIDHGKSTLADRMLELTHTIETRKMRDQVLDRMDLERERGITIKMTPVRMNFRVDEADYTLNLIDTPGHIDFSYEVSRALQAVEGSILLVDATQGVQAQTLTTLGMARSLGVAIIPVISKIDAPLAMTDKVKAEVSELLDVDEDEIMEVSGRTGEKVEELLRAVVERIPAPKETYHGENDVRALVFDFEYSLHQGVIVYVRVLDGVLEAGKELSFIQAGEKFVASEVGMFSPDKKKAENLSAGEIGYIVTGLKKPGIASVGDTITLARHQLPPLAGYQEPRPVVWASLYPESQDDFDTLKDGLQKLKLSDSSLVFEEETSGTLGRGFRSGFLGMLHLEIIAERLRREFGLELIVTTPSINYEVTYQNGETKTVYSPAFFPDHGAYKEVREPWARVTVITPPQYVSPIMQLFFEHEAEIGDSALFGEKRISLSALMPLRELMRNFFDRLKSASSGFASLSYEIVEHRHADVARLDILVAEEAVPAFAKVVSVRRINEEAEASVEKLHSVLPRQLFVVKIQGKALGRIISSRTLSAMKKDVTGYLYGGDITRKMKLREKQKKGKKKMKLLGRVDIPKDVFLKVMKD
ncbi:MAG: translation elongation factor 4 [Candidatus Paceibacterota bacterium]|jgi:GTP-binding protein LepA